jgi:hypothetical protein
LSIFTSQKSLQIALGFLSLSLFFGGEGVLKHDFIDFELSSIDDHLLTFDSIFIVIGDEIAINKHIRSVVKLVECKLHFFELATLICL